MSMYKHSSGKKWVVCKERLLPNPTSLNPSDMPPFHSASMAFGKSIPYHYLLSAQFWDLHCLESQCHQPCQTSTVNNRIEILSCHRLTQIDQTSVNNCCKLLQAVLVPDRPWVLMLLLEAKIKKNLLHLATSGLLLQQVFWSRLRIVEHTSWWSRFFPLSVQALSHSLKIEDRNFEVCQPSTLIAMQSLTDNMCVRTMQCTPFQPAVSCMPQIIQTKSFKFIQILHPCHATSAFYSTSARGRCIR